MEKVFILQKLSEVIKKHAVEICKKENCTGCFACMNICPKDAITVGEDEYAKTIPLIDKDKCIECGLCSKSMSG